MSILFREYLFLLSKFNGVILPDFSCYRDMPFVMQTWNIYRSRAIGYWLQQNGVKIIPNIRYGDKRTFSPSCDGISPNCVIAVGTHGTMKIKEDKDIFLQGLDYVVERLKPSAIVIYGTANNAHFSKYKEMGIKIHQFESDFSKKHRKEVG